ncbi:MAG: hypothetical protein F9K44_06185 [Hyphomicrobiaceae bacterium]|nr:MAG: hypothetical protein F9K44_06185 [Hyphomicrobiaceae bacterium]
MSFLKSLFGLGGKSGSEPPSALKQIEHNGFTIEARPYMEGGQFQTAGLISKTIDGQRKEHKFVRADRFSSIEEAAEFALIKGRQIVDEQGDRLFR